MTVGLPRQVRELVVDRVVLGAFECVADGRRRSIYGSGRCGCASTRAGTALVRAACGAPVCRRGVLFPDLSSQGGNERVQRTFDAGQVSFGPMPRLLHALSV